jgi:hypothetical protein
MPKQLFELNEDRFDFCEEMLALMSDAIEKWADADENAIELMNALVELRAAEADVNFLRGRAQGYRSVHRTIEQMRQMIKERKEKVLQGA